MNRLLSLRSFRRPAGDFTPPSQTKARSPRPKDIVQSPSSKGSSHEYSILDQCNYSFDKLNNRFAISTRLRSGNTRLTTHIRYIRGNIDVNIKI